MQLREYPKVLVGHTPLIRVRQMPQLTAHTLHHSCVVHCAVPLLPSLAVGPRFMQEYRVQT